MSYLLDFIVNNSLSCRVALDAIDYSNISIVNNTLILKNLTGNTNFDFIQTDSNKYPQLDDTALVFNANQSLYSRQNGLLSNLDNYTLVYLVRKRSNQSGNLIQFKKSDGTQVALNYLFNNGNLITTYSKNNLFNSVQASIENIVDNLNTDVQIGIINHDVKYGLSNLNINSNGYELHLNTEKGAIDAARLTSVHLGSTSTSSDSILTTFYYFMLFEGTVNSSLITDFVYNLMKSTIRWEDLTSDTWNKVNADIWDNMKGGY